MRGDVDSLLEAHTASFFEAFCAPAADDAEEFHADLIEASTCSAPVAVPTTCRGAEVWGVLECFQYNRSNVRARHRGKIVNLARCIVASQGTSHPIRRIRLVGHTDTRGTPIHNQRLGLMRARAVETAIRREVARLAGGRTVRLSLIDAAEAPRDADGGLPDLGLRSSSGSPLIDAGVGVGLDFTGVAPDLGAFELE